MGKTIIFRTVLIWTLCALSVCLFTTEVDDIPCDIESDNITCPDGYCCARNQSDFTDAFCRPLGQEGNTCPTYKSKYICPCSDKYFCQQNSNSSAFGICKSKIIDIPCDLNSRNKTCPTGMCCVRDEFLFTYTHCKAFGEEGSNCVTHPSFYECPCKDGFECSSNVQGSHVSSLFGSCKAMATAPPPVTTTTDAIKDQTTTTDAVTTTTNSIDRTSTTDKQVDFNGKNMVG